MSREQTWVRKMGSCLGGCLFHLGAVNWEYGFHYRRVCLAFFVRDLEQGMCFVQSYCRRRSCLSSLLDVLVDHSCVDQTSEPLGIIFITVIRHERGKFTSLNNVSAQEHASSKNRHILNFRVMAVRDIKLVSVFVEKCIKCVHVTSSNS